MNGSLRKFLAFVWSDAFWRMSVAVVRFLLNYLGGLTLAHAASVGCGRVSPQFAVGALLGANGFWEAEVKLALSLAAAMFAAGLLLSASGAKAWSPYGPIGSAHRRACVPYTECSPCRFDTRYRYCTIHLASCRAFRTSSRCP